MKRLRRGICILLMAAVLSSLCVCFGAQKDYSGYSCYVSLGDSIADATARSFASVAAIDFDGKYFRRDIGRDLMQLEANTAAK